MKRVVFAVYAGLGLPLLVVMTGAAKDTRTAGEIFASLTAWVTVAMIAGAVLIAVGVWAERFFAGIRSSAAGEGAFVAIAFFAPGVVIAALFRFDLYYLVDTAIYAGILGTIAGLSRYREDFSFLADETISESAKHARLDKAYDLHSKGLTVFTTLFLAGLISSAMPFLVRNYEEGRSVEITSIAVVLAYLVAGVVPGIYLRLFNGMQEIKQQYTRSAGG
ncbi:MAG: hypothetical protein JSV91_03900 [Phycisphaerales bacterium]|nr:MAG: hypothetical protein JSV91_03900 [Phycisphaerales bacterium]